MLLFVGALPVDRWPKVSVPYRTSLLLLRDYIIEYKSTVARAVLFHCSVKRLPYDPTYSLLRNKVVLVSIAIQPRSLLLLSLFPFPTYPISQISVPPARMPLAVLLLVLLLLM